MKKLEYPFDAEYILKKKKAIKRELLQSTEANALEKKIAILGGVTTNDIKLTLELFLLNSGIVPSFYESEYNQYYEDGFFPNLRLKEFKPDIIYICTSIRNIREFPMISDSREEVEKKKVTITSHFIGLWDNIAERYHCPIIQNNFEYPYYRLLGNMDASDMRGRVNFITGLNQCFYEYAQSHENFHICDINYISASYGLEKWSDPYYWHMYKYAVAVPAIPYLAFEIANIIKAVYGKTKKVLNLDLDNTLWGGVIGDDGADNIEIGQETSMGQAYSEFQEYLKLLGKRGVLLTVNSKNEEVNALLGFERPDTVLKRDDFASFKANWNPKSHNLMESASDLKLLPEAFVFVDDNPAEREIIQQQVEGVSVASIESPEHYIAAIDKSGYFEPVALSDDDLGRNKMYQENTKRATLQASFSDYHEYLVSLQMKAEIRPFVPEYMSRIAQLTNKSNQFNLTTKRYSQGEIEEAARDGTHITLYGKLIDKFGDNGVVSVVIGEIRGERMEELHMELWLMSCRVLKRDMEFAMMDGLVKECGKKGIRTIFGYYYPTAKNGLVKDFYELQGFDKVFEDDAGNTAWKFEIQREYQKKQDVINVKG